MLPGLPGSSGQKPFPQHEAIRQEREFALDGDGPGERGVGVDAGAQKDAFGVGPDHGERGGVEPRRRWPAALPRIVLEARPGGLHFAHPSLVAADIFPDAPPGGVRGRRHGLRVGEEGVRTVRAAEEDHPPGPGGDDFRAKRRIGEDEPGFLRLGAAENCKTADRHAGEAKVHRRMSRITAPK